MKTLLLTILMTISLFGQEYYKDGKFLPDEYCKHVYQKAKEKEIESTLAKDLVSYWKKYEKECYADSIPLSHEIYDNSWTEVIEIPKEKKVSTYPDGKPAYARWTDIKVIHHPNTWKKTYSHKEPTFEGFIEYLKKYIKE